MRTMANNKMLMLRVQWIVQSKAMETDAWGLLFIAFLALYFHYPLCRYWSRSSLDFYAMQQKKKMMMGPMSAPRIRAARMALMRAVTGHQI